MMKNALIDLKYADLFIGNAILKVVVALERNEKPLDDNTWTMV